MQSPKALNMHHSTSLDTRRTVLRALAAAGVCCVGASSMDAIASAPVYALLSLVGDELRVVGAEGTTGTRLSANATETLDVSAAGFDRSALRALLPAIQKLRPGSRLVPLLVQRRDFYASQSEQLPGRGADLPGDLIASAKDAGATHLILVHKHRAPARLPLRDFDVGTGALRGLGFYLDRVTPLRIQGTSLVSEGFLAPYVHLRVSLIELSSGNVQASQTRVRAEVIAADRDGRPGGDPWALRDDRAKLEILRELLTSGVSDAVTQLLTP